MVGARPSPAATAVIVNNTFVGPADTSLEYQDVIVNSGVALTVAGHHHLASLTVHGLVTHSQGDTNGVNLTVDGAVTITVGGRIDVTAQGYLGGNQGAFVGLNGKTRGPVGEPAQGSAPQSGGSYGSLGAGPGPNPIYGSATAPVDLGSGGAGSGCTDNCGDAIRGGNGGGRIHLRAQSLVVDGALRANGGYTWNFFYGGPQNAGGGGSGGSIFVELSGGTFSGSGVIEARGGTNASATVPGGGGRIAITGFGSSAFGGMLGRAGTIFTQATGAGGHLRLDGSSLTIAANATNVFSSFSATTNGGTIYNYGTLAMAEDALVVGPGMSLMQNGVVKGASRPDDWIESVTVQTNGAIWHSQGLLRGMQINVVGTLEVQAGGRIDVTAQGYLGGNQGAFVGLNGKTRGPVGEPAQGSAPQSGGSYGSLGAGPGPNPIYGSATAPVDLGSGGAGSGCTDNCGDAIRGGNGGGRIHLRAQSLVVDGALRANGGYTWNFFYGGPQNAGGGGSGGSIFVELSGGTFSGSGVIEARGGTNNYATATGGCGRIAMVGYGTNSFAGTLDGCGSLYRNARPVLLSPPSLAACESVSLTITNAATDADLTNSLTYTLLAPPPGASISAQGVITWTSPVVTGPTTNVFTTVVSDNGTSVMSSTNTFMVVVSKVTALPGFTLQPGLEGAPYSASVAGGFCGTPASYVVAGGALPQGLTLTTGGVLQGTPEVSGNFVFSINAFDAGNHPATLSCTLHVTAVPPEFAQVPTGLSVPLGGTIWLQAETRRAATFLWSLNGVELPNETNSYLMRINASATQAGVYRVKATSAGGSITSPEALVQVRDGVAPPGGLRINEGDIVSRTSGAMELRVPTLTGRLYRVERAVDLAAALDRRWRVVAEFLGDGQPHSYVDLDSQQHPSAFYRIVEIAANPSAAWSLTDSTRFVGLAQNGEPQTGLLPSLDTNSGAFGAFDLRVAGNELAEGNGLIIRFPNGAQAVEFTNRTFLRARDIDIFFGPDSFLQFAGGDNGVHHIHSPTDLDVPVGPADVRLLETLLGRPANSGVEIVCFRAFRLQLLEGTFDSDRIRNAQLSWLGRNGTPLPLALPGRSGDFANFHLDLNGRRLRIPFHGDFPLPDGTSTPPMLRIPAQRPLWLELRSDNTVAIGGSGTLEFPNGPRFATEFSFDDPDYALRFSASRVEVPPLLGAVDLLPRPPAVPPGATEEALNLLTEELHCLARATRNFAALTVGDATGPDAPTPATPAFEVGPAALLEFWTCVAEHGLGPEATAAARAAAKEHAQAAESSEDLLQISVTLENAVRLRFRDRTQPEYQFAVDRAMAAAKRVWRKANCATLAPTKLMAAATNVLRTYTVLQQANPGTDTELLNLTIALVRCSASAYCARLGVTPGQFTATPQSAVARMPRAEALDHLRQLLIYHATAQQLGDASDHLGAPMREALSQLDRQVWADIEGKLTRAIAANDRRTFLLLAEQTLDLMALVQSGILDDVSGLPTLAILEEKFNLAFRIDDEAELSHEITSRRVDQLRDDFLRVQRMLDSLPSWIQSPPPGLVVRHSKLGDRLVQSMSRLEVESAFTLPDLLAFVQSGLAHEELRLRLNQAGLGLWRLENRFTLGVTRLRNRAVAASDWSVLHVAAEALLWQAERARLLGASAVFTQQEQWRGFRRDCLVEAARLLESAHTVGAGLWLAAEARRSSNPALALAGIALPQGFRIDNATGELRYNTATKRLRGAFTGKLVLPKVHGTLEVLNGTFDTGGAFDVSAWGTVSIPGEGGLINLTVPRRRPLHFARKLDGHVTLEGFASARLKNGIWLDAWASLDDPTYRFGAAMGGVRFNLASNLTLTMNVPDVAALASLPQDTQQLALEYLRALGSTLEPLADPDFVAPAQIGTPPQFSDPRVSVDLDPLIAGGKALELLSINSSLLGFQTLDQATDAVIDLGQNLARELARAAANTRQVAARLEQQLAPPDPPNPPTPEEIEEKRVARRASVRQALASLQPLRNSFIAKYRNLVSEQTEAVKNVLVKPQIQEIACPISDVLFHSIEMPEILEDPGSASLVAQTVVELIRVQTVNEVECLPDRRPAFTQFILLSRGRTLAGAGLDPNTGLVVDATRFAEVRYQDAINLAAELRIQKEALDLLQPGVDESLRFNNAIAHCFAAMRNDLVRQIREREAAAPASPATLPMATEWEIFEATFAPGMKALAFAKEANLTQEIQVLDFDGTVKTMTSQAAADQLVGRLRDNAHTVGDFSDRGERRQLTGAEKRLYNEFIRPRGDQWVKDHKTGLNTVTQPIRLFYAPTVPLTTFQEQAFAQIKPLLQVQAKSRIEQLADEAQREILLTVGDALERLQEFVSLAELVDLTFSAEEKAEWLGKLQSSQTPAFTTFTVALKGVAESRRAWWLVQRASQVLAEAVSSQAHQSSAQFQEILTAQYVLTRDATATLIGVLRDDVRTQTRTFNLQLPGDLQVEDVHGEFTFNRRTSVIGGCVGGRLVFPELGTGSWFDLQQFCLSTDGSFSIAAGGRVPVPGVDDTMFEGTLTANGHLDPAHPEAGTLTLSGSGSAIKGVPPNTQTARASLTYALRPNANPNLPPVWRLRFDFYGDVNEPFCDDFVLFAAGAGFAAGNEGGVEVHARAKAGLWRRDRNTPLPTDRSLIRPEMFQVIVDDVLVSTMVSGMPPNILTTVSIKSGVVRLPQDAFFAATPQNCPPGTPVSTGPQVSIPAGAPITVSYDAGTKVFSVSGGIAFAGFGAKFPGLQQIEADLCSATLVFPGTEPPRLENVNATLRVPRPGGGRPIFIDLLNGRFDLKGLPTGTMSLRHDVTVLDLAGFKWELLGSGFDPVGSFCPAGTGLTVTRDTDSFPIFNLHGGMRVSIPREIMGTTGAGGGAVSSTIPGCVEVRPKPNSIQITPHLESFCIGPISEVQLGTSGPSLKDVGLCLNNLDALFQPGAGQPFNIAVSGKLDLPNGPAFGLQNAKLTFTDPARLPRFSVESMSYAQDDWALPNSLPMQISNLRFGFHNPDAPFPDLFQPSNLKVRFSAGISLPSEDPILSGQVNDVRIVFDPNGVPSVDLDGFDLSVVTDELPIAMLTDVTGQLRIGGLSSGPIWMAGKIGGRYQGYKLVYNAAFTLDGPIGLCLDVNLGDIGIPLDGYSIGGVLVTGAAGGVAFLNTSDPCDFKTYFDIDPTTGADTLKSGAILPQAPLWESVRALLNQAKARTAAFASQFPPPTPPIDFPVPASPVAPLAAKAAPAAALGAAQAGPSGTVLEGIPCPGDCPPATVNILCQPHPDRANFPNRVIFKFTSIPEATLNADLPLGLGFTRQRVNQIWNQAGQNVERFCGQMAGRVAQVLGQLLPSAAASGPLTPDQVALVNAQREVVLVASSQAASNALHQALASVSPDQFYGLVRDTLYQGLPCADISIALAGRMTYQPISYLGFLEGRVVGSTAGTVGAIGTLYVLGIPLGEAELFLAFTDANGAPNPSACGTLVAALGPLEFGDLRLQMDCPGCVTGFIELFPKLARIIGEPMLRDVLTRAVPEENFAGLNTEGMIAKVISLQPRQRSFAAMGAFFATLPTADPRTIPGNLGELLRGAVQETWNGMQPKIVLCGGSNPKLFGFPVPIYGGEMRVTGMLTKTNIAYGFACSPSGIISYLFSVTPPLGDRATWAVNRPIPDPIGIFLTSLDGTLESPERLAGFLRQQADAALDQMVNSINYEFHPFGLPVADAAARMILPDVLNHPSLRTTPWVAPENRGQNLPSRVDVLVAGATSGRLGNAAAWFGNAGDFARIFSPSDPRSNIVQGARVDLRSDYFPHGGLVGGGQLALPKILQESPANWLPTYETLINDGDLVVKFNAAMQLINDHILRLETNGYMAFYVPAPNPPVLTEAARTQGPAAARNLMRSLSAAQLMDDLRRFDPTNVISADLYPAEVAFFQGNLGGSFLGIPIANGSINARRRPAATTNAPPGGTTVADLTFSVPSDSWLAGLVGQSLQLNWQIKDVPPQDIISYFSSLAAELEATKRQIITNLSFAPASLRAPVGQTPAPEALLAKVRDSLGTQLPKFAFTNELPPIDVYTPTLTAMPSAAGPVPIPLIVPGFPVALPGVPVYSAVLSLCGFSPAYAPDTPGDGPIEQVKRQGGVAAKGALTFFPRSVLEFGVPDAELSISPDSFNGQPVPRIVGRLRNVTFPTGPLTGGRPLFPGFSFGNLDADFDNLASKFFRMHTEFANVAVGPVTATSLSGNSIRVDLEFQELPQPQGRPSIGIGLKADPLRLALPFIEPSLALHGTGGLNERLELTPEQLSAAGELREANGNPSDHLELKTGNVTWAQVSDLPAASFTVAGRNLGDFTATVNVDLNSAVHITLLPGQTIGGLAAPNFALPFTAGGDLMISLEADGDFNIHGHLANGLAFPPLGILDAGATVTINRGGATITGESGGASATLTVDFTTGQAQFSGMLRFAPFCVFDNRVCLSGPGGGDITFQATANGPTASGVELRLVGFHPNGGNLTVALPEISLGQGDVFSVFATDGRPAGLALGGFELGGLDQFDFNVAGDFRQHTLTVQMKGRLALPGIVSAEFDASLDENGFSLASRGDSLRVLDFDFGGPGNPASLIASGGFWDLSSFRLHFSGGLTLPFANFQMEGDIPADGPFTLQPSVTLASLNVAPNFPLKDVLPQLKYEPGNYGVAIAGNAVSRPPTVGSNPAGYWRLADSAGSSSALDGRNTQNKRNGTYQGGATRELEGAFGPSGNAAAGFDGTSGHVRIPPSGLSPSNDGFTVELWFRRTSAGDICPLSACDETLAGQAGAWSLALHGGLASQGFAPPVNLGWTLSGLTRPDGSPAPILKSGRSFRDTDWHHVIATWDGLMQALYVDGQLEAWQSVRGTNAASANNIGLGARINASVAERFFEGQLDEVAIYSRALSPVDVANHWAVAGRGSLRLQGQFDFPAIIGLSGGPQIAGVLNRDGGWALELSASAPVSFVDLNNTYGLVMANGTVSLLHRPGPGGDIVSIGGVALLPPMLGGGLGQRLRAVATAPDDFLVQVEHNANLDNVPLPLYLTRLRVERHGGTPTAELSGRISLPFGPEVSVAGGFSGTSFDLYNPSGFDVEVGGPKFRFAANGLHFSPQLVQASGSFTVGAKMFSTGSLRWQAGGSLQLSVSSDTEWEEVKDPFGNVIAYQRLAWNVNVGREGLGWNFGLGGTFAATLKTDCPRPQDLAAFPGPCNLNLTWLKSEVPSNLSVDTHGGVTVSGTLGSITGFPFDLW